MRHRVIVLTVICASSIGLLVLPARAVQEPRLVLDINTMAAGSSPEFITDVGGTAFFRASDSAHGRELWKSDGTLGGTVLVKDIDPGLGPSFPSELTDVGGTLYFTADDRIHGYELWRSDGTPGGTVPRAAATVEFDAEDGQAKARRANSPQGPGLLAGGGGEGGGPGAFPRAGSGTGHGQGRPGLTVGSDEITGGWMP